MKSPQRFSAALVCFGVAVLSGCSKSARIAELEQRVKKVELSQAALSGIGDELSRLELKIAAQRKELERLLKEAEKHAAQLGVVFDALKDGREDNEQTVRAVTALRKSALEDRGELRGVALSVLDLDKESARFRFQLNTLEREVRNIRDDWRRHRGY